MTYVGESGRLEPYSRRVTAYYMTLDRNTFLITECTTVVIIFCITCFYHYCASIPVLTYPIIYALRELDYIISHYCCLSVYLLLPVTFPYKIIKITNPTSI